MAFESIIVEIEDHICVIKLNRPESLNALSQSMLEEFCTALEDADANDKVRCIIITGSNKAFAAGAEIKEMSEMSYVDVYCKDLFAHPSNRIKGIRKPIIAAVAGYALGGGCELAMACDFIIAADNAKFGQPEINLGVIPGMGGSQRLTHAVGKAKSMDMNLTGRFMEAAEAERSGLVSRVVETKELMDVAISAAHKVAEKSLLASMTVKDAVNRALELPLTEGLNYERRVFHALFATEDQSEGMAAFVEKRAPQFRDR